MCLYWLRLAAGYNVLGDQADVPMSIWLLLESRAFCYTHNEPMHDRLNQANLGYTHMETLDLYILRHPKA